jgi:predicted acetyltransferase
LSVPDALQVRRYDTSVDVVLEVEDRQIPANARRWRLVGSLDQALCTPTDAPADLRLDVSVLGAAYLGGASLGGLAAGGLITELTPGALARTDAAFGWVRQPSAIEIF